MPKNILEQTNKSANTHVVVAMPDTIEIELVQANELKNYEIYQWLVTLLAPTAAGFWTAYASDPNHSRALSASALAFTLFSILFTILAFVKRASIYKGKVKKICNLADFTTK